MNIRAHHSSMMTLRRSAFAWAHGRYTDSCESGEGSRSACLPNANCRLFQGSPLNACPSYSFLNCSSAQLMDGWVVHSAHVGKAPGFHRSNLHYTCVWGFHRIWAAENTSTIHYSIWTTVSRTMISNGLATTAGS